MAVTIFLTEEAISANDAVYVTPSGYIAKSIASNPARSSVVGIALDSGPVGAFIRVNTDSVTPTFSGLTPGQPQFLSPSVSGRVVDYAAWESDFTALNISGLFLTNVGRAVSSGSLEVEIQRPIYVIK